MAYAHDTKPSPSYSNDTKPSDSFDNDNKGGTTITGTPIGLLLALTHTIIVNNSYTNDIKP